MSVLQQRSYAAQGGGFERDTSYITTTVDDPEVLSGLQLSGEANHQLVLVPQVVPIVALGVGMVVDPDQPGTLTPQDVATLVDDLETGRAAVVDLGAGRDHQDAVGELDAALTAAGLDRLAREALDTGAADVVGLATAADEATAAWLSFLDEIQGRLLEAIQEG